MVNTYNYYSIFDHQPFLYIMIFAHINSRKISKVPRLNNNNLQYLRFHRAFHHIKYIFLTQLT